MTDEERIAAIRADAENESVWGRFANFAGLSDEEKTAIDQWCYDEARRQPRATPDDSALAAHTAAVEQRIPAAGDVERE